MTRTLDIPKENWASFLEALGRGVAGSPVRVEVEQSDIGDQLVGRLLPLRGLELETKGSQMGDLQVLLGRDDGPLTHRIPGPKRIWVGYDEAQRLQWVAIEQEDEAKTLLHFEQLPSLSAEATQGL